MTPHLATLLLLLIRRLGGGAALDGEAAAAAAPPPSVHTAFCAECTASFDWKSLGMFHSHRASGMRGPITRLLACSAAQLAGYKGLTLGPTFVHPNYGVGDVPGYDRSPTYNKPGSLAFWLAAVAVAEDFILYVDADMLLRAPIEPLAFGARPGLVVSEHVGYLDVGIGGGLLEQFLPREQAARGVGAAGGWYHLLHTSDAAALAPRWLHFCREVRSHPERYWALPDGRSNLSASIPTGDAYVGFGGVPWIAEMYGYVLAAAERGMAHNLTHGLVVYADDTAEAALPAAIIHYGLHCYIERPAGARFHFTKYDWGSFEPTDCAGTLLPAPPQPSAAEALCAETVESLNDALCAYYAAHCPQLGGRVRCPPHQRARPAPCVDRHEPPARCAEWAAAGECARNAGFMHAQCRRSCNLCADAGVAAVAAAAAAVAVDAHEAFAPLEDARGDGGGRGGRGAQLLESAVAELGPTVALVWLALCALGGGACARYACGRRPAAAGGRRRPPGSGSY